MIKNYFSLTKPGIIMGNALTAAGGFALASRGHIDPWLFLATITGLSLIIASACVLNNYLDRHNDAKMARTKHRALVKGVISVKSALIFAIILGCLGFAVLGLFTNLLAAAAALAGVIVYVLFYTIWKYRTVHGTLIGSVAGAAPPAVGYLAASGRFDMGALLIFLIVVLWQMPHFFAIALYRIDEYAAASIPVLPIKRGAYATKVQMLLYVIAFSAAALMLPLLGYTGYVYMAVASLLGIAWLWLSVKGFKSDNDKVWARSMFRFSLVVITLMCAMISFDVIG